MIHSPPGSRPAGPVGAPLKGRAGGSLHFVDRDGPGAGHGLVGLQHLVLALLVDAVGPAVPGLHADEALGVLLPEHAVGEAVVGVHRHLVAVAAVGKDHGELHAGQQADGVVRTLFAGQGDLLRGGGLLALGVLRAGGAVDVKVYVLQLAGHEIGVVAEAERHGLVPIVDDGQVDGSGAARQVIRHQQGEVERIEELGQRGGLQHQGDAVGPDAVHLPGAQVGQAVGLHGVGLAVKDMDAAVRVGAAGEQNGHREAGAVALAEIGAADPDVLVLVQGKAGDHAAPLGGDDQFGLGGRVRKDVLLVAGLAFGDVPGADLIHKDTSL